MSWSRSRVLVRQNWELLVADPAPVLMLFVMPLVMMAFLQGTSRAVLLTAGYQDVSGAELVVPGMAVMFAFFTVSSIGTVFFAEHGYGTWDRLRASQASSAEIMLGKILPSAALMLLQVSVLFVLGVVVFGMQIRGSVAGVGVMVLACVVVLIGFAVLLMGVTRRESQALAAVNLGAIVLAGMGGALAPVDALPGWAQAIAPLSPAYWMLRGFREVILEGHGIEATILPAAITILFGVVMLTIGAAKFNMSETKVWAA